MALVTGLRLGMVVLAEELKRLGDASLPVQATQVDEDIIYYLRNNRDGATYVVARRALSTGLRDGEATGTLPPPEDLSTLTYT